jgi:hypothetical protein
MAAQYARQPLRVPAGVEDFFGEDLLQMRHDRANRLLDVGWYPSRNLVTGEYGLVIHEGDFRGRELFDFRTRDRHELVREIERLLEEIAVGRF